MGRSRMNRVDKERAAVALFQAGFNFAEVGQLLRWSERTIHAVIRRYLR